MRICVVAVSCFLVAVVTGSPVGEGACPLETGDLADLPMYRKVPTMAKSCYETLKGNTSTLKGDNLPTEVVQSYFNTMCPDVPTFRACLEEKASSLEVCSNPNMLKMFNILRDTMIKTVETGCAEGGKLFVTLAKGFSAIGDSSPITEQVKECGAKAASILGAIERSTIDISSKFFILYKEFSKFVECVSKIQLEESLRESLDHYFNEMLTTMKCIHPQDGTLVTCASIGVDSLSAHSICEAKTHGTTSDLYDILEGDAHKCLHKIMAKDAEGKDITTFREAFKEYCEKKSITQQCVKEPKTIADTCLNDAQNNEFKHVMSNFHMRLDTMCGDDARRLADIMYEVYRLKKEGHGNAVLECIEVSRSARNEIDEHRNSSKNMRYYHELESFKTCLVNKLHGDQANVDAATSLVDEMLKKVECPGVEAGTAVTCESLMQNHHHDHNHH